MYSWCEYSSDVMPCELPKEYASLDIAMKQ